MTIQIKKIKINRNGPLLKDFEMEPGALNVIFGRNESGKTFLVEAFIELLFKNKKNKLETRSWDITGRIQVSGLNDKIESFTKSSKKIDQFWEDESQLPEDLMSLLVVKGGETALQKDTIDGVGHSFLKNFLSAEGILDQVEKNIPKTLRVSSIENKDILGEKRGELNKRKEIIKEKEEIQSLLKEVEQAYTSRAIGEIKETLINLDSAIDILRASKCHEAFKINQLIAKLKQKSISITEKTNALPSVELLATLKEQIHQYQTEEKKIEEEESNIPNLNEENYTWLKNAEPLYQEYSVINDKNFNFLYFILSCIFLIITSISSMFNLHWGTWFFTIFSAVFLGLFYRKTKTSSLDSVYTKELENLKSEYKKRFTEELTDHASLKTKLDAKTKEQTVYEFEKSTLEKRSNVLQNLHDKINKQLYKFADKEVIVSEWNNTIEQLEITLSQLQDCIQSNEQEIQEKKIQIAKLDVSEEKFLEKPSDFPWDESEYAKLLNSKMETEALLNEEEKALSHLQTKVCATLKIQEGNWESLISYLREALQEKEELYINKTAEIIAKIKIYSIIKELREKENERIEEGLQKKEVQDTLSALTGRYNQIRKENEEGLIVINSEDEEFSLSKLSTGAKDQVFLALRTGFAKLSMQSQSAFLILDDAFQHSDWERRKNLVTQIVKLAESGWQIFYFTMDNHLKILLQTEGEKLGNSFKLLELADNKSKQE